MTIATTLNKITYNGDGVTTVWSYSFTVSVSTDLQVYITNSSGVATLLLSGYTVDTTNKQVTYPTTGSPLAVGSKITLLRSVDTLQSVDWKNQGPFNAEVLEQALDKSSMQVQQLTEALARSIKLPQSEVGTDTNTLLPTVANRAAMFLAFDASGNPIPASGISSTPVSAFMSTVLDDTTALAARATLGIYPDQSLGASGTAGSLSIFPSTALKGSLRVKASNNTGDTITDITAAPQAGARTFTIPDPGTTSSSVVLTDGAQTINGVKTFTSPIGMSSQKITTVANGTVSSDAATFGQIKVIQTVFATGTTNTATSSATFVATNVTANITPTSASNRIMIVATLAVNCPSSTANAARLAIFRNAANIQDSSGGAQVGVTGAANFGTVTLTWIDSPATTSSTTYAVYGLSDGTSGNISFGNGRSWAITLQEIV